MKVCEPMTSEKSTAFSGFHEENMALIRVPVTFFTQLMPIIGELPHLKLLLYMFWYLEQQESNVRYFTAKELASDPALVRMTGNEDQIRAALESLVELGAVLKTKVNENSSHYYFINGPQGRAAVDAIENGQWQDAAEQRKPIHMREEQPNIFKLYEENIGAITPMMAEILKDDEAAYPNSWIKEAIEIAVTRNARNWKYVQAILERWQKEGRGNEQHRRDDSQDPSSYRKSWLGRE